MAVTFILIGYISLGVIVVLVGATTLLCSLRRVRKHFEKRISEQHAVIDKLAAEKTWLLKEVHHRVKNNLQTVVSLLELQSAYLRHAEAVSAIQDSQNRVHAMSLIHHKLYRSEAVSSIDMAAYLAELLMHLRNGFPYGRLLRFSTHIDAVELEVSQAIPVGLILSEAITNAIKYAFPAVTNDSIITISMSQDSSRNVSLSIADNGSGLPANFDIDSDQCGLGIKLMKGLADDIDGEFRIMSMKGVTININFTANIPFHQLADVTPGT